MKLLGEHLLVGALSLLPTMFGGYLVYEKVYLAVRNGHAHERVGVLTRVDDPVFFWVSVGMAAVFGTFIALLGLWGLWRTFRSAKSTLFSK